MSESDFMARLRTVETPESMPVSRAIRDFMVAHPPTADVQPQVVKDQLIQLLMLSVMRLEGRVMRLEGRSEVASEFLEAVAELFSEQG